MGYLVGMSYRVGMSYILSRDQRVIEEFLLIAGFGMG